LNDYVYGEYQYAAVYGRQSTGKSFVLEMTLPGFTYLIRLVTVFSTPFRGTQDNFVQW
jgi:hypothetical protein